MSCEFAHHDGAYVLGALSPEDRQQFERHLADCVECARATRELAGIPGLLARLDKDVVESPPVVEPVSEKLLPALISEVRRTRRRRAFVATGLSAAAAVTVAFGSAAIVNEMGTSGARPSAGTSVSAGEAMTPILQHQMSARLAFETVPWGTKLDLTCRYVALAEYMRQGAVTYELFVHTSDGRTEQVASWASSGGKNMELVATTAIPREDITSVEVRTTDGTPVLKMTA